MANIRASLIIIFCMFGPSSFAEELKGLQGTWVGTEDGHENEGKVTLEVNKDQISYQSWREGEWYKGLIEVVEVDGKTKLLATITECPIPQLIGKTCNGIYELDGDNLSVASRAPGDPGEPEGFDDPKCRSMTFKRRK